MSKKRVNHGAVDGKQSRRRFTQEFKEEAVQMLLDGNTAAITARSLALPSGCAVQH